MSNAAKRRKTVDEAQSIAVNVEAPVPIEVDGPTMAFGGDTHMLLPPFDKLPRVFQMGHDPWCTVVQDWFFKGLKDDLLTAKPGIDKTKALRHCNAIMRSWAPKHEHKIGGVAYLMSHWFEPYGASPTGGVEK